METSILPYAFALLALLAAAIAATTKLRRRPWAAGVFVLGAAIGVALIFVTGTWPRLEICALLAVGFGLWGWQRERAAGGLAGLLWGGLGLAMPLIAFAVVYLIECPDGGCLS